VNEVAWKPVGIGPPGGPTTGTGAVVVAGLVVELDGLVVVEATVAAEVDRGEEAVVLPHSTVGVILMVVGAVGFVISTIVFAVSRRPVGGRRQAYDRETVDAQGRSTEVHEKTK